MPSDDAVLLDLVNACRRALEFKGALSKTGFIADAKTQSAVLHQLLIVGEAVKRLSNTFRDQHAEIPWRQIAGMRDNVIHEYDNVDLDEVWTTLTRDLPELIGFLQPLLPRESSS